MQNFCVILEKEIDPALENKFVAKMVKITGYDKYEIKDIIKNAPSKIIRYVSYDFALYVTKYLSEFEDLISLDEENKNIDDDYEDFHSLYSDPNFLIPTPKGSAYIKSFEFENFKTKVEISNSHFFNKDYFLFLISRSISLSKKEKFRILFVDIPKLSKNKIDDLILIFEEEKRKFNLLSIKKDSRDYLIKEMDKANREWLELEDLF